METTRLGRTTLKVTRTSFGALPIQRTEMSEAVRIIRRAYDGGITFFDTARGYTDSEEKLGNALSDVRDGVIIATKTSAASRTQLLEHVSISLKTLRTDHVDILQLHNPTQLPNPEDPESSYAGAREAKEKGMARFIGISSHALARAVTAVESGLYDTLQYPLCSISSAEDLSVINRCRAADVGLIAMKALCGGLITNARSAFAFLRQFENVVPIWGIQRMSELEEILELDATPPALDDDMQAIIEQDRRELADNYCRGCGYCLPCPAEIPIHLAARMGLLLRRAPYQQFLTVEWRDRMHRIEDCQDCGQCRERCPYEIDAPALLRKMLADYDSFYEQHVGPGESLTFD